MQASLPPWICSIHLVFVLPYLLRLRLAPGTICSLLFVVSSIWVPMLPTLLLLPYYAAVLLTQTARSHCHFVVSLDSTSSSSDVGFNTDLGFFPGLLSYSISIRALHTATYILNMIIVSHLVLLTDHGRDGISFVTFR